MSRCWVLPIVFLLAVPPASADNLVEPSSQAAFERQPKGFVCLGVGLRKVAWIKVYAVDFCVDAARARAELETWFAGPGKRLAGLRGSDLARALEKAQDFFDWLAGSGIDKRAELVFLRAAEADK